MQPAQGEGGTTPPVREAYDAEAVHQFLAELKEEVLELEHRLEDAEHRAADAEHRAADAQRHAVDAEPTAPATPQPTAGPPPAYAIAIAVFCGLLVILGVIGADHAAGDGHRAVAALQAEQSAYDGWRADDNAAVRFVAMDLLDATDADGLSTAWSMVELQHRWAITNLTEVARSAPHSGERVLANTALTDLVAYDHFTSLMHHAVADGNPSLGEHVMTVDSVPAANRLQKDFDTLHASLDHDAAATKGGVSSTLAWAITGVIILLASVAAMAVVRRRARPAGA